GIQLLAGLRRLKSCTLPSPVTSKGLQAAVNWPELETLVAHKSRIDADAGSTLRCLRKLKRFYAPFEFGNEGLSALSQLEELQSLHLLSPEVNADGLRHLAG